MENIVEQFNRYGQQFPKKKILQYVSFSNQLSGLLQFKQAHPTSKLPKNFHFPNVPNPTDFEAFIYLVSSIKLVADYIGFNCKSTIQGLIENFPKDIKIPLLSFQVINDFSDVMKVLGIVSSKISCYMDAEATAQQYIVILNRWYQDLKVFGRLTLKGLAFEGVYGPDKLLSNRDVHLSKFLNIFSTLTHKKSLQDFSVLKDFARYLRFFDPAATQYSPQIQTLFVKFRTYLLGFIEIYCFLQGNELDPQEILPEKYRQVLMNFWEQQEATEVAKVMLKKIESFRLTNKKNLKCRLNFQDQGIQALKNKFKALNDCNLLLEEKLKNISVQKAAYENKKNENSYVIRLLNQTIIQFNKVKKIDILKRVIPKEFSEQYTKSEDIISVVDTFSAKLLTEKKNIVQSLKLLSHEHKLLKKDKKQNQRSLSYFNKVLSPELKKIELSNKAIGQNLSACFPTLRVIRQALKKSNSAKKRNMLPQSFFEAAEEAAKDSDEIYKLLIEYRLKHGSSAELKKCSLRGKPFFEAAEEAAKDSDEIYKLLTDKNASIGYKLHMVMLCNKKQEAFDLLEQCKSSVYNHFHYQTSDGQWKNSLIDFIEFSGNDEKKIQLILDRHWRQLNKTDINRLYELTIKNSENPSPTVFKKLYHTPRLSKKIERWRWKEQLEDAVKCDLPEYVFRILKKKPSYFIGYKDFVELGKLLYDLSNKSWGEKRYTQAIRNLLSNKKYGYSSYVERYKKTLQEQDLFMFEDDEIADDLVQNKLGFMEDLDLEDPQKQRRLDQDSNKLDNEEIIKSDIDNRINQNDRGYDLGFFEHFNKTKSVLIEKQLEKFRKQKIAKQKEEASNFVNIMCDF